MSKINEHRKKKATLERARQDPASLYDKDYYETGCSISTYEAYGRREPWLSFFGNAAKSIKQQYAPKTAVDIGCAFGLLVEAMVDLGIDAYGFDVSPFAISNARPDVADRLKVGSLSDPIPLVTGQKYDMVICIEVLEHLPPEMAKTAIQKLCAAGDCILFSSSPDDFDEPTHFNVQPVAEWLKMFANEGFYPVRRSNADFVAKHAFVVKKTRGLETVYRKFFKPMA